MTGTQRTDYNREFFIDTIIILTTIESSHQLIVVIEISKRENVVRSFRSTSSNVLKNSIFVTP